MRILESESAPTLIYNPNKQYYDTAGVPESYARMTNLLKPEEFILSYLRDEIKDKALLDIGVGPGRTTPYLRSISSNYTGTDYSENMLAPCRAKYADANLVLCDARRMDRFEDQKFDAVFFLWNAIDDADPEDRILILSEIHRVLKANGIFVFSAHNLEARSIPAWEFQGMARARKPARLIKENATRLRAYLSIGLDRLSILRKDVRQRGYSILHEYEAGAGCVVPTYYISKEAQTKQLQKAGFDRIEAVDKDGAFIAGDRYLDYWYIYYIARKV